MEKSNCPAQALLGRIADALGVPVENFLTKPPPEKVPATTEHCLRLWAEITTEAGKQQALQALRMIVIREEALRSKDL